MSSPFDSAKYEALLKGLNVTVLGLKEVLSENEKFRIDDGYFSKIPVFTQKRIEAGVHVLLGNVASVFRKGIFDIKADSYADSGIPFVRIGDLRGGLIETANIAFIPAAIHNQESKTALKFGDIILSKTAYPTAAFVNLEECNVSQDTIAVRLKREGSQGLKSGYIVAFLNSCYGISLMQRQFQGNVQLHLSLPDGKKLPIPLLDESLQNKIHEAYILADRQKREAKNAYIKAEQILMRSLNLDAWQPPEPLTYTRRATDVFAADRFDAEHFQEKYYAIRGKLQEIGAQEFLPLNSLLVKLTNGHTPLRHDLSVGEVPFLCAEHVSDFEINYESHKRILYEHHQTELANTSLQNGDILLTIKGRVGNAAMVENISIPVNINQDVALLRLNNTLPIWYVLAFLNSPIGKLLIQQLNTGGINPFLGLSNVQKLEIPIFSANIMEQIAQKTCENVHAARSLRQHSKTLLNNAKRAVEIAIERSEAEAMAFLEEMEK